jgi:hypothetical protein
MQQTSRTTSVVLWVVVISFLLLASFLSGFPWSWW